MIDEQNFPTVTADDLVAGDTIWHGEELRTVAEVNRYRTAPSALWVLFNDGTRVMLKPHARFPRYVPAKAACGYCPLGEEWVDPGAWVDDVVTEGSKAGRA